MPSRSAVALSWRNPASLTGVAVRYKMGAIRPLGPTHGRAVHLASAKATKASVSGLAAGMTYTFAVWTRNSGGHYSGPVKVSTLTTSPPAGGGAVQGTVTDNSTGAPVAGVTVHASAAYGNPVPVTQVTGHTGPYGLYTLEGLTPEANYKLCFDASTAPRNLPSGYASACVATQPKPYRATTGVSFQLETGWAIVGKVSGSTGAGVPGVRVALFAKGAPLTTTGPDGRFSVLGLDVARLPCFQPPHVGADGPGYLDMCATASSTNGHIVTVNQVLTVGAAVSGTVKSSAGPVLPNARVGVESNCCEDAALSYQTTTDAFGHYKVAGLAGLTFVGFTHVGGYGGGGGGVRRKLTPGKTVLVNATLAVPGVLIGGVTGTGGRPLRNVAVSTKEDADATNRTDSNGMYQLNLNPDVSPFTVCFDGTDAADGSTTGFETKCGTTPVPVSSSQTVTLNMTLAAGVTPPAPPAQPTGTLTGRVMSSTGRPLRNVIVTLPGTYYGPVVTRANGSYTETLFLFSIPASYKLCYDASQATGAGSTTGYASPPCQDVTVAAAVTAVPDAQAVAGGAISGRVTAHFGGAGLDNVKVVAFNATAKMSTVSGNDGSFVIRGIPAGAGYALCFNPNSSTAVPGDNLEYRFGAQCYDYQPWRLHLAPSGATRFTVTSGQTLVHKIGRLNLLS